MNGVHDTVTVSEMRVIWLNRQQGFYRKLLPRVRDVFDPEGENLLLKQAGAYATNYTAS
jgi:hypothetical protein